MSVLTPLPPLGAPKQALHIADERDLLLELAQDVPDVISLGLGDPDFATPAHIVQAAQATLRDGRCDRLTDAAGLYELRHAIAAKLVRVNDLHVSPDTEITVTTGGQEGLYVLIQAILDPGDEILVPDPRYSSYDAAIARAGGVLVSVPTTEAEDFALDPAEVERRITPRTKALLLVTPGNPTAAVVPPATLRRLAEVAQEHDLLVISDEIYEYYVYGGAEHLSIGSLPGMAERTITLNGFSKAYAMTGWRLGYVVAPPAITQAIRAIKTQVSIAAPTVSQWAGVAALTGPQDCIPTMRDTYDRRRVALMTALTESGYTFGYPSGAFYIFTNISHTGLPAFELSRKLLTEAKVLIFPGTGFGEAWSDYMRFSLLQPIPVLQEAVARMNRVLK